jgi:GGDEF domain-containing protein
VVARHGGDEFALVLLETAAAAVLLVGHRICDLFAKDAEMKEKESQTLSVAI